MEKPRQPDSRPVDVGPAGGESLDPVPGTDRYSGTWRALFAFVAIVMVVAAVALVVGGGWENLLAAVGTAWVAGTLGFFAVTGRRPASDRLYTPSRRFRELADPTRPLTRGDLVAGEADPSRALPEDVPVSGTGERDPDGADRNPLL